MSRIIGTIPITGTLSKVDTNDAYPLISNQDIKGGYKVVKSITERDNIPQSFLEEGLIVYIENTNQEFLWTNNTWKEISRGNGSGNTISNEPNNAIEQKSDGLYVPKVVGVNISADEGNKLENRADGLYVAQNELEKIDLSQYVRKDENGINGQDGQDGEDGATFTPIMTQVDENTINLSWSNNKNLANPQVFNVKGEKGDKGDKGERGEKGEKGDPGERGADAVLPNFKTINGESLIGDGDISPVTEEVKEEIRRAVNADILPNLETMGQALQNMQDIDKNFKEKVVDEYGSNISELQDTVNIIVGKINKLFQVIPEEHLDYLLRWSPANTSQWSNVFGGSSVASNDIIQFNNQKSAFLAPENVTGIQFKLRGQNNPGGYILWFITSVNSQDQSDVRALTMNFSTYMEATYTSWIKPREGHTAYDGTHGATAQNIKDVFNVHNVEITVLIEDGKIKCSNTLGYRFEVNAFAGGGFVNRLGLGSQVNFSNNIEAYDIKILTA